jgi:stage II sporulation protein D
MEAMAHRKLPRNGRFWRGRGYASPLVRPNRSLLAVALAVVLASGGVLVAAPAEAKSRPTPTTAKPAPAPGWTNARVRVEPLDPAGEIVVAGTGAYRGAIVVGRATDAKGAASGPVTLVNDVGLDDYVQGIAEVPSTWPAEALKAQAIAARTYALHELAVGHTLCATESCQVYAGLTKERGPGGANWVAAVQATHNQVLLYKNQPILAMYSSSNGGETVAGSAPYLTKRVDPDDAVSPLSRWTSTFSFSTLTTLFATPQPVIDIHRTASDTVELIWNNPDQTVGTMDIGTRDFQARLNANVAPPPGLPRAVPSLLRFGLTVDQEAGTFTVDGQGFGHGIGMSQFGALGKAQRGMGAADILAFYYGGIKPTVMPPGKLPSSVQVMLNSGVATPVTVTSPGPFRVVGADGQVLARMATGSWQLVPTTTGVRVVPPAGQTDVPAVTGITTDRPASGPVTVSFHLSAPAQVTVAAQPPDGRVFTAPAVLLAAGDQAVRLPVGAVDGPWHVTVTADAGAGRTVATPADITMGTPPPATTTLPVVPAPAPADVPAPAPARASAISSSRKGTPLAVGMTGVAGLTLLAAVGALAVPWWRKPESEAEPAVP